MTWASQGWASRMDGDEWGLGSGTLTLGEQSRLLSRYRHWPSVSLHLVSERLDGGEDEGEG